MGILLGSENTQIARRSGKPVLEILLQLSRSQGKGHRNPCLLGTGVMKETWRQRPVTRSLGDLEPGGK